jgi:hypothetical protein
MNMSEMTKDLTVATLQRGLEFSKTGLDTALMQQASLFFQAADLYAAALNIRDGLKDTLKQVSAEIYMNIRKERQQAGTKVTEGELEAIVDSDPGVIEIRGKLNKANYDLEIADGLRKAYSERNFALKALCDLYSSGYWQKDSVSQQTTREAGYSENRAKMAAARKGRAGSIT